jgi:pimeloyl-ACP methyl ester carboxylesterase
MMNPNAPTLPGVTERTVTSKRLTTRVLFTGDEGGIPVLFLHGNASSATYWEETMLALPAGYRGIAPDQRGYGGADPNAKIDATRGMGDLADDAAALLDKLDIDRAHLVGHSMGGSVIWRFMMDYPERCLTVTLAAPGSPFGFGGTKDVQGTLSNPDGAGSGGGTVNPNFTKYMAAGERGIDDPQGSPRIVMNSFYWKPPFVPAREEDLLTSLLSEHVGEREYPGDSVPSPHWPFVAPGKFGPANALSPIYAGDVSRLYHIDPKPPVLWIRGADDQIVGDQSLFDMGTLGALGAIPGWPGADVYPSQPMVGQTRYVLEQYQANGGQFQEVVFENCGHTPYIEKPAEFNSLFHQHLQTTTASA